MTQALWGKRFGAKGYLSQAWFEKRLEQALELSTTLRKHRKNSLTGPEDKLRLRQRFIVETVTDQLKNVSHIEPARHRKPLNFAGHLFAGLIAYQRPAKKPSLNLQVVPDTLPVILYLRTQVKLSWISAVQRFARAEGLTQGRLPGSLWGRR